MGIVDAYTNEYKYVTNYTRIGPFLTAYSRRSISNLIGPNIEYICRVVTDGFIVTNDITYETGKLIGELKLDNEGSIIVNKRVNVKKIWK